MKSNVILVCLLMLILITVSGFAQTNPRDKVAEGKIEQQLAKLDPGLVEIFRQGTIALDADNLSLADSLYTLVYQKQPTFDPVLRRLGGVRVRSGNVEAGLQFCQRAVDLNRSLYNLLSLARCYVEPGNSRDLEKAMNLIQEAQKLPGGDDIDVYFLLGQVYLMRENSNAFTELAQTLKVKYPDELVTHYYLALSAVVNEKWIEAKREIKKAKRLGLPQEEVDHFLDSGVGTHANINLAELYFAGVFLFWAVGLLVLFVMGKLLSGRVLNSLDSVEKVDAMNKTFRSLYKWLINVGGVYYYFSLPIILVLVIALVGGLGYLFFMIGHIPVKIMLLLVIGSAVTIYSMIRSLLVKTKYVDPGRELKLDEAPGLYNLATDVAGTLKTRPIDEIRITYGTDLAVYENGSWFQKQQDKARRILILGAAVVVDFRKSDFLAVLAHEYGHFSHRDTAGGNVALRVRGDMHKYLYALYSAGQNVWWNIAFHFLRLYDFIFRRISSGSTRLQEILADKVAAQTYGPDAFRNGLTHVIKRELEFSGLLNLNVEEIRNARPSINVYGSSQNDSERLQELDKELNRNTTEDDTHPSPADRFRFTSMLRAPYAPDDPTMLSELFTDWTSVETEMRTYIDKQIALNL